MRRQSNGHWGFPTHYRSYWRTLAVFAETIPRWLRPRRQLAPVLLATMLVWTLPATLLTMGDVQPGCTPFGCLEAFLDLLFPGSWLYLALTYPTAAVVTAGVEHVELDEYAPWLFAPTPGVARTAVGVGLVGIVLFALAGGNALFTWVGRWVLYTLFVPVFDAVLMISLVTSDHGIRSIWPTIAVGIPVVICQVCWWYGIAHGVVMIRQRIRR